MTQFLVDRSHKFCVKIRMLVIVSNWIFAKPDIELFAFLRGNMDTVFHLWLNIMPQCSMSILEVSMRTTSQTCFHMDRSSVCIRVEGLSSVLLGTWLSILGHVELLGALVTTCSR